MLSVKGRYVTAREVGGERPLFLADFVESDFASLIEVYGLSEGNPGWGAERPDCRL